MVLIYILRRIIPHRIRLALAPLIFGTASQNWVLLKWYLVTIYGKPLKSKPMANGYCYYDYEGRRIVALQRDAKIFMEIFEDKVYERVWQPKEGDVVLDLGGYVGMFTVKASVAVGATGKVVTVEPSPESYKMMESNCQGLDNVLLVKKAVAAENGKARLYYSGSTISLYNSLVIKRKDYIEVETITVDDLVEELGLDKVDIVKMDVEGATMEVLKGMQKTLEKGTKLVIAAYHLRADGKPEREQIARLLKEAGYTVIAKENKPEGGLHTQDGYLYAEKL